MLGEQVVHYDNQLHPDSVAFGLKCFAVGLAKKVLLADQFGRLVDYGYSHIDTISSLEAFLVMICFSFQIYFDFSGYCDMGFGISKCVNLDLPVNFNSPYKATSIRDFWKRWHISLTKFFTNYIYIPLGGNRKGKCVEYINVMIVFLISGLWHGANWTFLVWGAIHGVLSVAERILKSNKRAPEHGGMGYTFLLVSVAWVFFRAESLGQACQLLKKILLVDGLSVSQEFINELSTPLKWILAQCQLKPGISLVFYLILAFVISWKSKNIFEDNILNIRSAVLTALLIVLSLFSMSNVVTFIYNAF